MSRHLEGGTVDQLADTGYGSLITDSMKLMSGGQGIGGFFGGSKEKKEKDDDFGDDAATEDDEDDDEEFADGNDFGAEEEEEEDEDDGLGAEEDAMDGMMGGAVGFVGDKFGLRRKKFQCDIHHIRITNLGRRRRDVQVIFTLGAMSGEGGAATLSDVLPSSKGSADASGSGGAEAADDGNGPLVVKQEEEPEAGAGGGKKRRSLFGRKTKKAGAAGAAASAPSGRGETSKHKPFKTDVAVKVERGRTFNLKKKYHDTWKGKHKDLPHRVLHMTLVEQVRKQAPLHGSAAVLTTTHHPPSLASFRADPIWQPRRDWHFGVEPARAGDGLRAAGSDLFGA